MQCKLDRYDIKRIETDANSTLLILGEQALKSVASLRFVCRFAAFGFRINMKKASIIYEETRILTAKFNHPKSDDYLDYTSIIKIKEFGKNPIEMTLNFCGIPPFGGPMPPKDHTIKAPAILDLYSKVARWFRKYGYILI